MAAVTPAAPAVQEAAVRGYLVLGILEASGKTQKEEMTWDTSAGPFEPFVKVELRGGPRSVKTQTRKAPLVDDTVVWGEELRLELLEGSNELRLMVCREKISNGRKGTAVIAACGIFVSDILDAVPLNKFFQLFRPAPGGEGGYILISMNFVKDLNQPVTKVPPPVATTGADPGLATGGKKGGKLRKFVRTLVSLSLVAAAAVAVRRVVTKKAAKE